MTTTKSIATLSTAVVLAFALTLENSLADGTTGATPATISLDFKNAPAFSLIEWVTRLSNQPVVVPYNVDFPVTLKTERKLTREEAIEAIDGVLRMNGYRLVKPDKSYYRVVKASETNSVLSASHIELEVQGDRIVINGNTIIDRKDLAASLATLSNAETEVWIHHPVSGPRPHNSNEAMELLTSLRGLDANKMFLKFMLMREAR
jgi:type II secretory pathway component GspD/PulD (secretin)